MVTLLALAFDRPAGSVPPRPSLGIPAVGDQQSPTVAFDGMDYLVVWDDARAGERDIFGARVSRDGIVLDEGGFSISREPGSQGGPFVASGTGTSLVVWTDTRAGQLDTYGARVSQSGQVLDPAGISIATSSLYREWSHGLAFDGSRFLAMWWLSDPNNAWYNAMEGRLVSQAGTVGPFIQVDAGSYPQYTPSPAFGETNYLVGWVRYNAYADIYARRVTPDGAVLDPGGIPVGVSPDGDFSPALAFGLGQFLVVWDRGPADEATRRIFGARVTESGTVLDEDGLPISAGPEDGIRQSHSTGRTFSWLGRASWVISPPRGLPPTAQFSIRKPSRSRTQRGTRGPSPWRPTAPGISLSGAIIGGVIGTFTARV